MGFSCPDILCKGEAKKKVSFQSNQVSIFIFVALTYPLHEIMASWLDHRKQADPLATHLLKRTDHICQRQGNEPHDSRRRIFTSSKWK